jgi:hypothetical protein
MPLFLRKQRTASVTAFSLPRQQALRYLAAVSAPIVCKPTAWFYQRALGMLAMFLFLGGWFFQDASTGYRKENQVFFLNRAFITAAAAFQQQQQEGMLTDAAWRDYAAKQTVDFGEDLSLIPASVTLPMPWPQELHDSALLAKGQVEAWEAFTGRMQWDRKPPEKLHEASSIREQWYFAYGLSALALYTSFILLRTMRRRMCIDEGIITTQDGRNVPVADLTRLDLRKWGTKGLAFAYYPQNGGKEGRIRIDGLTYGGFQKDQGEPAEALMRELRAHFTGEVIEYASEETTAEPAPQSTPDDSSPA